MIKRPPKNSGLWQYLDALGILEQGTDAEIKQARRNFKKIYYQRYKQQRRKKRSEFTIGFLHETGDFELVKTAAKKHNMAITTFIRLAVTSYLKQKFVVPNEREVIHLENLLSQCLNEIQKIVSVKERHFWERDVKLQKIEDIITKLERDINWAFRYPPLV